MSIHRHICKRDYGKLYLKRFYLKFNQIQLYYLNYSTKYLIFYKSFKYPKPIFLEPDICNLQFFGMIQMFTYFFLVQKYDNLLMRLIYILP